MRVGAGFVVKPGFDFDVDHAIPKAMGGLDHPMNYFVMPQALNKSFGSLIDEKLGLVGRSVARRVAAFAKKMAEHLRGEAEQHLPAVILELRGQQ